MRLEWTVECENAFQILKRKLITSPALAFPDYNLPFELHTDASARTLGYGFMQKYPNASAIVISYGGRMLSEAEKNYTSSTNECE